jgi:hypothetical protein
VQLQRGKQRTVKRQSRAKGTSGGIAAGSLRPGAAPAESRGTSLRSTDSSADAANHRTPGGAADSRAPMGGPKDSQASEGVATNSRGPEGRGADSRAPEGGAPDSRVPEGGAADSRVPEGGAADSRVPEGGAADSRVPEGGAADSQAPEGRAAGGRASGGDIANNRAPGAGYADSKEPDGRPARSQAPEVGPADSRAPDGAAAESLPTEGRSPNGCGLSHADGHRRRLGLLESPSEPSASAAFGFEDRSRSSPASGGVKLGEVQVDGSRFRESTDVGQAFDRVHSSATVLPEWVSSYTVGRDYKSVAQYWNEWAHGKPGCPLPLREIEKLYGCAWRRGRTNEIRYFSKFRKVCIIIEDVMRG